MVIAIHCSWCGKHQFKVDPVTATYVGVMELLCPICRKVTTVSGRDDGSVFVLRGSPDSLESPRDEAGAGTGIYAPGHAFDFFRDLGKIITETRESVFVVDPYADDEVFVLYFDKLGNDVSIRLLTRPPSEALRTVAAKFAARPGVRFQARASHEIHDRVVIVDTANCWVLGQSIKDAALRKATYLLPVEAISDRVDLYETTWQRAHPYSGRPQ